MGNLRSVFVVIMAIRAKDFLKISPMDIYCRRVGRIPSPTKEHIVPQKYLTKKAVNNPHNIFICTSLVNSLRGSLPFGVVYSNDTNRILIDGLTGLDTSKRQLYESHANLCIKNKRVWMPPIHARGPIARTCMYMYDYYPDLRNKFVVDPDILEEWGSYPITQWEKKRNKDISLVFGIPPNHYIL